MLLPMSTTAGMTAEAVLEILRAHEAELRAAGIRRMSLFGSVARGEAGPESDVDLAVELDPEAHVSLLDLVALDRHVGELLGRRVELLPEPVERPRLRANIERDRLHVF